MYLRFFTLLVMLGFVFSLVQPTELSALLPSPLSLKIVYQIAGDGIGHEQVQKYENYLYTLYGDNSIKILSLQNPAFPVVVGNVPGIDGLQFEVEGHYLYVHAVPDDIYIYDLSNPITPELQTILDPGDDTSIGGMAVQGNILYLSLVYPEECDDLEHGRINIYDVSNPQTPVLIGSKFLLIGALEMDSDAQYLYVLRRLGSISIYDISDPSQLVEVGEHYIPEIYDIGYNIIVKYDTAYMNYAHAGSPCYTASSGFLIVNVANPTNPLTVFELPNLEMRFLRTVADGYLYTASWEPVNQILQTKIFSIRDYNNPVAVMDANEYSMVTGYGYVYALRNYLRVMRLSAVDVDVSDGQGYSLVYTDTVGLATQLAVAPGTVISGTNVSYLPLPAVDHPYPADHPFLEQAFDLAAYNTTTQQTFFAFQQPITLTLPYSADQFSSWQFLYWDGQGWQDGGQSCGERPAGTAPFTFQLCRPGQYALFVPLHHTYLPLLAQTP